MLGTRREFIGTMAASLGAFRVAPAGEQSDVPYAQVGMFPAPWLVVRIDGKQDLRVTEAVAGPMGWIRRWSREKSMSGVPVEEIVRGNVVVRLAPDAPDEVVRALQSWLPELAHRAELLR